MLTEHDDFDDGPHRAARPRAGETVPRAASWDAGERGRRVIHELLDLAERCLLGAGVMLVLAAAALLLIRSLAR